MLKLETLTLGSRGIATNVAGSGVAIGSQLKQVSSLASLLFVAWTSRFAPLGADRTRGATRRHEPGLSIGKMS